MSSLPIRCLVALLAVSLSAACASSPGPSTPVASPPAAGGDAPAGAQQCAPTQYAVKGSCFDSRDQACAAAGCEPASCLVAETAPMQIHCGG